MIELTAAQVGLHKQIGQRGLVKGAQEAIIDPENVALVDGIAVKTGLVNLVLRDAQQIARAQRVRQPLHDIANLSGKAEHQFVKIMAVRFKVQIALIAGVKQPVGFVQISAACGCHDHRPFEQVLQVNKKIIHC